MDIDHFCLKCQGGRFSENIWHLIGRTDAEAETAILWSPDVKNWLIWKDPGVRNDWRWEEKGTTEDEMAGWHNLLDAHEFGWTPGVGDGQGGLVCCDSWGCKESDTTEWLNWTEGSSGSCYGILTVSLPLYLVFARQSGIHCILCPFSLYVCMCVLSCFSRVRLFVTLWTVTHQTSLSMDFSRQEHWSGLPCSPPGDLPDLDQTPLSCFLNWQAGSLPLVPPEKLFPLYHSTNIDWAPTTSPGNHPPY